MVGQEAGSGEGGRDDHRDTPVTADDQDSATASRPPDRLRYQLSRRQAWFAAPRTDAAGRIRPGAHLRALAARTAGERVPLTAPDRAGDLPSPGGPQWNPLGPAGVCLGEPDGRPRVSGRVTSIAAHPGGQRAYAGTACGGTWYTADAGLHWRCLDTFAEAAPLTGRAAGQVDALAVSALVVEWGAGPGTDVVYVGTGDPVRNDLTFYGVGVRVATGPAAADPLDPTAPRWRQEAPGLADQAIYRLAADPARHGVVYAATTAGVWRRAGNAAGGPAVWTKVFDRTGPDGTVLAVSDVVIAPARAGQPQTIYVAVYDDASHSPQQVWRSQSGDGRSWAAVPGYTATNRTALAVAPSDPSVVYALSRNPSPSDRSREVDVATQQDKNPPPVTTKVARLHDGKFEPVFHMPTNLAGTAGFSQAYANTVLAVDPLAADVIWMGGAAMWGPAGQGWNAALFRGQVKAAAAAGSWTFGFRAANMADPAADPSWVGAGAHADVCAITFSGPAAASTVWVGCDGGIFQCTVVTPPPATGARGVARNTAVGPWRARNDGLAITQPTHLAQTPVSDSLLLAGTQDNGVEERIGPAAWKVVIAGDAGGCVIDPGNPNRRFAQWGGFTWNVQTDPAAGYTRTLTYDWSSRSWQADAWHAEDDRSAFYSGPAARVLGGGATALAFGSYRLWYCENWAAGTSEAGWRTLPTGTNPYEEDADDRSARSLDQDSLRSQVIRVAFIDDNRLLVLTRADPFHWPGEPSALYLLTRTEARWYMSCLSPPDPGRPAPAGARDRFPEWEVPAGLAVDDSGPGSCYVTLGVGQHSPGIDRVWWYDGSSWWPCRFDAVADTPVNAVVVDRDRTVYVGTDAGVWKGVPGPTGEPPAWDWSPLSHGLPDAPVFDLAIYPMPDAPVSGLAIYPKPHLLRAATCGRGVWELNLDETAPVTETYLRAHPADTRRVFPAGGNDPGTGQDQPPAARIDASPDIVIAAASSPADANYLDMALLDRIKPAPGPAGGPSLTSPPDHAVVYVQVNARGWRRRPAGTVHVGLLATPSFDATLARLPALPADWMAQFLAAVTTAPGKWLAGGVPWAWIGSPATMATARPLHPEEPQVVRFTVSFPRPSGTAALPIRWTLLAVTNDPLDAITSSSASVRDLVLNDRHVAVRSVALHAP